MEQYPSIDKIVRDNHIFAYDKIDGSNIRVEWSRKTGHMKYGSRTQLIDATHPTLGDAIAIFQEKYADVLDEIYRQQRFIRATAFLEFHGPNSFAGFHVKDEPHDLTLFDVHVYKQGLMPPREFNKVFKYVDTAPLLYEGKANSDFIRKVKTSTLEGMTFEGVVCKSGYDAKNRLANFKIKSNAWLQKLKTKYADDERMFNKLA